MKASDTLRKTIEALQLSVECLETAKNLLGDLYSVDILAKYQKDWLNDVVSLYGKEIFETIMENPNQDFLRWLTDRIDNPYLPGHRAIRFAGQHYGFQITSLFNNVRWHQEIAWAKRMRVSEDDITACLAETWLKLTKRDPDRMFKGLLEVYTQDGIIDPRYRDSNLHFLSPDEIENSSEPPWKPLWLRFSEKEFKNFITATTSARRGQLADKIRSTQLNEKTSKQVLDKIDRYRKHRLVLRISVLSKAIQSGLSSDDLLEAESNFLDGLETGRLDFPKGNLSVSQMFSASLPKWAGIAVAPNETEFFRRLRVVENIEPRWAKNLPFDIQTLGGTKVDLLFKWFDTITSDKPTRLAPLDPLLDFSLFIVEDTYTGSDSS